MNILNTRDPAFGSIELQDSLGDDLSIVNAARVSFNKESQWDYVRGPLVATPYGVMPRAIRSDHPRALISNQITGFVLKESDVGLINYLMKNRHGTPFEMVQFKLRLRLPIRVMWEWIRHRIASYNGVSSRYVEMETIAYLPPAQALRTRIGKPGHYQMVQLEGDAAKRALLIMETAYEHAFAAYKQLIELGMAGELAANVLPFGTFTEFIWSINLRSMMNFLSLRNEDHALLEIHALAAQVEDHVRDIVPVAMESFIKNGRVAP